MKNYKHLLDLFLDHLNDYASTLKTGIPKELYAPEEYMLSLGGKRLRPLLALVACDLFDKDPRLALNSALAVELFHNFSLVHDDILDAAPLRRNKATVHTKWNTNIAILSGDMILVKSFKALENYPPSEFKPLVQLFNKTAIQVCEGQQLDMNFEETQQVSVSDYLEMITGKTAVLLGCSLQMGAINAGAGNEDQEHIYGFGKHLGIAFQLMDDLLDAFAEDSEKFGKQPGGDIITNKKTFLLLKALELASEKQKKEITRLLTLNAANAEKKVSAMLDIYRQLGVKKHCEEEADRHTQLAISFLGRTGGSDQKKESLRAFAVDLLQRQV